MNTDHNSNQDTKALGERINRLMDQIEDGKSDLKDLYVEAKSNGHDVPALKKAVARQREDADKRKKRLEQEEMIATYTAALGGLSDLPLGKAAIENIRAAG
jgi:uncharacterized protein (UPF0335 family)